MLIKKCFLGLLGLSFFSVAGNELPPMMKHPNVDSIANLTPTSTVMKNVISQLEGGFGVSKEQAGDVTLIRMSDSDLFQVELAGVRYTINADAKYWLKGEVDGVYVTKDGRAKGSVASNDMLEFNQRLRVFLMAVSDLLPVYGDITKDKVVFAFVDLSCPYCQQFHLVNRSELEKQGVTFVYVPFVRDPNDKRVMDATRTVFCNADPVAAKMELDSVYLNGPRNLGAMKGGACSHIRQSIIESLLVVGHQMGIVGTPMFLMPSGEVIYGTSKLNAVL